VSGGLMKNKDSKEIPSNKVFFVNLCKDITQSSK